VLTAAFDLVAEGALAFARIQHVRSTCRRTSTTARDACRRRASSRPSSRIISW
jgi:hypothetical protein